MLRDTLTAPIYFQDSDPWLFSVINSSLTSMKNRDDQLADAIDAGGGLGGFPLAVTLASGVLSVNYAPSSWSVTKTGTGVYTISHTIGNTSYIALPAIVSTEPLVITASNYQNNSFVISIFNQAGTLTDSSFNCFISRYG